MKQILFFAVLVTLTSCVNQRQKSNITGRTDEVYFTPSDTRIKVYSNETVSDNSNTNTKPQPATKNYSGSYADRLSNFGSTNRFNYSNYQPTLAPTLMYNNYTGWGLGLSYGAYNSPFSPYYGCNMPYNNPFYANGWGGHWMTGYNPYYTYNPYMFNYNPYGGYYGSNNYNPYYNSNNNTGGSGNYSRRTGGSTPSGQYNNTGVRNSNNTPMRSDNPGGSNNTGRVNSSSGSPSGSSSSGRSGGGTSGGSTRRR